MSTGIEKLKEAVGDLLDDAYGGCCASPHVGADADRGIAAVKDLRQLTEQMVDALIAGDRLLALHEMRPEDWEGCNDREGMFDAREAQFRKAIDNIGSTMERER